MNRLSWDTTAPRRPRYSRGEPRPDERSIGAEAELLRPAWDEIRKIHRY
jgi:hypothetical protein